ncbi:maltokinase [Mycolicibacterium neoaurum]|uniref:maltokinase N-terminal cap-like domain-containing protein n=1 Tax=Mycolicibacterium neoaurum TaxID=1795 RepID=UPI00056936F5|nr:phosphotransferase [Mycolicibacterium neoaurum]SDF07699.1 maltokinase [Mycolicibacterium neoaurum]
MTLPFAQWLPRQRWYGGRGRDLTDVRPTVVPLGADLDLVLLEVDYADGSVDRYQVVVRWDSGAEQTAIGTDAGRTGYDALTDPEVAARLLGLIEESATLGPVGFLAEPDAQWGPAAPVRSMGAEQSNTSIVFGDHAIMKAFRRLTPGINPDIELTRALAGNPHITPLLGSYEIAWDGEQYTLGMLSVFAKGSSDGWSVAERRTEDLRSAEADFGQESHRLGEAVASVHLSLAETLGSRMTAFPAQTLIERARSVAASVPQVAERLAQIEQCYRQVADEPTPEQRVHGDLHLGQVLHTPTGWLIIDFEGEPGQPLAERRRPDSPLRDVAGMLRSYDYVASQRLLTTQDAEIEVAAREWVQANRKAFCDGYASVGGLNPWDAAGVLLAYELDKAVYEVGYESRYRPTWLPIPLGALDRLLGN